MKLERSLIVNALVLGGALATGVVVFVTRERASTDEQSARVNNLCPQFSRESLQWMRVTNAGREFTLERDHVADAGAAPFSLKGQGPADAEAVESLLRALEIASYVRRFDNAAVDRAAFGLDRPRATLSLHFLASELTISVGKAAPTPAGTSYVAVTSTLSEPSVGLVKDSALKDLLASADDLRPKTLLPLALSELKELSFKDAGHEASLHRGAGPSWLDAHGERVQRDAVDRLGYELFALKAERFLSMQDAEAALDAGGALDATFTRKDGVRFVTRFGGQCPSNAELSVFVRREPNPSAACVAGGARQLFWNTTKNLTNDSAFDLHMDEVETLRIERGEKKLEIVRGERGFALRAPSLAEVPLDVGNRRIQELVSAEGTRIEHPDLAALGLSPPAGKVTLHSATLRDSSSFDEVVELGRPKSDGRLPLRRPEDGVVLLFDREHARAFEVDSTLLRKTALLDFGPSDFVSLEVWWGHEHELLQRTPQGAFELKAPAAPHDAALSLSLVQALGTLNAERWVADEDDGSFGLASPRVRAVLELTPGDAGTRRYTLLVGSETTSGVFARFAEQPGVFVLSREFVSELTTLLITRAAFSSDEASVERVELSRHGKKLVLARRGSEMRVLEGPALPPAAVSELLDALGSLRPESAVHTGAALASEGFEKPALSVRIETKAGLGSNKSFRIGAGDSLRDTSIFYARVDGIDATFALTQSAVRPLLDAL